MAKVAVEGEGFNRGWWGKVKPENEPPNFSLWSFPPPPPPLKVLASNVALQPMISDTPEYSRYVDDSLSHTDGDRGTILKRKRVIERDEEDEGVHGEIRVRPPPVPESRGKEALANDDSGRYHDDDEDEDYPDDPPRVGCQVLPVADLPEDFAGEPQDGMQYLFTVRSVRLLLIFLLADILSLPQPGRGRATKRYNGS